MVEEQNDANRYRGELTRRRLLTAVGAGATVAASGGVAGANRRGAAAVQDEQTIRPSFGYSAASGDETPPVEPTHEIELRIVERGGEQDPAFFFQPTGSFVEPGDVVRFSLRSSYHTITAYHPDLGYRRRVPREAAPISSPLLWQDGYFLYEFRAPGVYDLFCALHQSLGMATRLVVGEASGPGAQPVTGLGLQQPGLETEGDDQPLVPPYNNAALVLADSALDPERIVENERVRWQELSLESRGVPEVTATPTETETGGTENETDG